MGLIKKLLNNTKESVVKKATSNCCGADQLVPIDTKEAPKTSK